MRLFLTIFLLILTINIVFSQPDMRDDELKQNVELFRQSTLSLGIDTIITYKELDGKVRSKRLFLTVGTGVLFYFNYKDLIVPCIITAKHVLRQPEIGWNPKLLNL